MIKVLMFSTDRTALDNGSGTQKRMVEYGTLFEELHIVVFTKKQTTDNRQQTTIDNNIWVYPTNSRLKILYLWDAYQIAKSLVISHKLSVITCQDPFETGFVGWLLKLRYKLPLQFQIHTDVFSPYFKNESLLNRLRVLLAKFLLPRADGIRVVSERIKQSLKAKSLKLKAEPVVLPIFVDIKKIQSAKVKTDLHNKYPEHDFIILMASRLTKEKNIGMAIEAFNRIRNQESGIRNLLLLIVGDGPELKSYKLLVKSYKLENNVQFESVVDSQTLFSYYKTADLFLLTSNYEGYGRTVVEAMAAGLPVVMTDVGIAGELLIDDLDGKVVPIGDQKALAKAILELMENSCLPAGRPPKREEFKQNSLKLLEKWPVKKEYLEKYRDSLMMLK
ncbi:MAG: glycosyltransferase family 4 protein [Candidatus Harrisonbacteria bacterium]|nr:glycosyltransferase family 4 protein [Candidatus Harrisonbacteria bacterium]